MSPTGKEYILADPTPHKSVRRRRFGLLALLALSLLAYQCITTWAPGFRSRRGSHPCPHSHHDGALHYPGEKIGWNACGSVGGRPVECSSIDVPMDQFSAPDDSGENKTFSIPLVRLRGHNATQNLLLNPGGPGGSGAEFVFRRGKIVGDGFHLLSFDPRGVNRSAPLASCYPTPEARRSFSDVDSAEVVHDSPRLFAWTHNFVRACEETMGEYGAYVNTPQTAADMNSILDAVGQDDMIYWGFSYGTVLGQTYAQLFPERSRRVIIDGVVNNFDWYDGLDDSESFTDTENVLEGFFDECIKAGDNCTLSALADSKEELHELVFDFSEKLKAQPISVYVNTTLYGVLDYPSLWYGGIFPAMYRPPSWYSLADNLAKLLQGNATAAFLAYGLHPPWDLEGDANSFVVMNDGLTGPEYWPQGRKELLDLIIPAVNQSIFAPSDSPEFYSKQQWTIPRTHNYTQEEDVETAHPLLVLSTTYDPVCPLVSAKTANRAYKGSKLVEVQGYGHCSVAVPSTCLARHVRAFLYHGTLPDSHTTCEVDGPYFVPPEENGAVAVAARRTFESAEDEKIHLAQLELARDWEWRVPRSGLPIPA